MLKILFINQRGHEYMQSILFDGLKKLGHLVYDYPFNETLHYDELVDCDLVCSKGRCTNPSNDGIGCQNHSASLKYNEEASFGDIKDEKWDLIITNNGFGYEALYQEYKHVPIAALDLGDSQYSSYEAWTKCLGRRPDAFFRRETPYGDNGIPLTFAFYDDRKYLAPIEDLKYNISAMFRPTNPNRAKVVAELNKVPNVFVGVLKYPEYLKQLSASKFTLDLPGAATTCVRTTEIAGRGSVIVRPRQSVIRINNDFSDANCVEFSTFNEAVDKINYYLNNAKEYELLRMNSWKHFNEFHTTTQRAKELLNGVGF